MKRRLLAFLIDHLLGTLIIGLVLFAVNWDSIIYPTASNYMKPFETSYKIITVGMIYYLLKDIYKGRSIGKIVLKLAVRDKDNASITPGIHRLLIRNITIVLWPIEALLLFLTQRRIGDILARTQVKQINYQ